ncbi:MULTISPECIES: YceI family protein [unclassified Beijerinckia]|uniref:YceI family protein n=1 Tax=unclassified Beijerinckia TaxID=2638183 RepID=UPI0008999978|nr:MULTISPECIES: YceI family protein [unclassified Beijerinckia]MDH7794388.1 polyisoprenoid-binding protein YceI [Beijerinckia sp. GAS462]SEB60717.1 Polyisoprenoid-binding protein YceI [Beijerinckia sp. 28-YEA-48]
MVLSPRRLLAGGIALALSVPALAASRWSIDPARTTIGFVIDSTAWPRTQGTFNAFSGRISLDFEHPERSRVDFTVQAASVEVGSNAMNDYLRSEVFFNAARYPAISFASTHVEKLGPRLVHVTGNLTLLGVTRPININVEVDQRKGGERVGFSATGSLSRSAYGMNSGVPIISDTVHITVVTEARQD